MEPLLKWPGGKRAELSRILPLLPDGGRVVEPFAGGAAVSLALEPRELWLNDADGQLVDFYRRVASAAPQTRARFAGLAEAWRLVAEAAADLAGPLQRGSLDDAAAARRFAAALASAPAPWSEPRAQRARAEVALADKRARLAKLAAVSPISSADMERQLATALHGAFYGWLRDEFAAADDDARAAAWWFLRELCYGSMFRYNAAGRFNIPYGGASYNSRDLAAKVERLFGPATAALLARATLTDHDFRAFFAAYAGGRADDIVFVDPPYDSAFSSYGNRPFGPAEQAELVDCLAACGGRVMAVLKATPLTERLYGALAARDARFRVGRYGHQYGYNMRGRNERAVDHLLVVNYRLPAADLLVAA